MAPGVFAFENPFDGTVSHFCGAYVNDTVVALGNDNRGQGFIEVGDVFPVGTPGLRELVNYRRG